MGTHPIFESDFDCLTDMSGNICKIKISIKSFDHSKMSFRYEKTKPLGKLMKKDCQAKEYGDYTDYRFKTVDGDKVEEDDTAEGLCLEDGDAILIFRQQIGGRFEH